MGKIYKYSKKPIIYGSGLVALDIVISSNPKVPTYQWAGGTCGNVLTILSYLGWNSYPVARLNSEPSATHAKNDMKKWDVKLDLISTLPVASIPVITQEIIKGKDGLPKHKFHWKNCPKCGSWLPNYKPVTLKATEQLKEKINNSNVFFFDRTSAGTLALARHCKQLGAIIFFEPSAKGDPKHFAEAVALSDIVKYSFQRFPDSIIDKFESEKPFLEIQTLGEKGLRYRAKNQSKWSHMSAYKTLQLVDACGCGDWTTAGIIHKLFNDGEYAIDNFTEFQIEQALRYGQALGAWNCAFEGARSGMYQVSKNVFNAEIDAILNGELHTTKHISKKLNPEYASDGLCPSCP